MERTLEILCCFVFLPILGDFVWCHRVAERFVKHIIGFCLLLVRVLNKRFSVPKSELCFICVSWGYLIAAQVGLTWYFFIFVFFFSWNFIFFVLDLHNQVQEYYLFCTGISHHWGCLHPCPHSTEIHQWEAEARNEISYTSSVNSGKWLNPLDPNISIFILHTDLYSFPKLKTWRIIVSIKSLTPNQSPGN